MRNSTAPTRDPDGAAAVLAALERRARRAGSWTTASVLAAELRLDAAEVARALARLATQGRAERRVDWDRHGVAAQWRLGGRDAPKAEEAAG